MEATAAPQETKTRTDVYTVINDRIIEQLNKGCVPWQKPWAEAEMPRNLISGKPYRGLNVLLLGMEGYEQNLFLTFDQVKKIGGKVKRGSKGHTVVHWHNPEKKEGQQETQENDAEKKRGVLKYYTVFNIVQCENIPERYLPVVRVAKDIAGGELIVKAMPKCPRIQHKEAKAYYDVVEDFVNMPKKKSFKTDEAYYSTLFHELVHSTGHDSRLARQGVVEMSEFGDEMYSKEELVAEIGTCYLLSFAGIAGEFKNSAAYIQGWLSKLKSDKRIIFIAAKEAQKAVDYILDVQPDQAETVQDEE